MATGSAVNLRSLDHPLAPNKVGVSESRPWQSHVEPASALACQTRRRDRHARARLTDADR